MNIKLTYKPSLLDRIVLFFGWIECQLRSDLIPALNRKNKVLFFTTIMQRKTESLLGIVRFQWAKFQVLDRAIHVYGAHPETEITATSILTPALLYLHFRLCLEIAHYRNIVVKTNRKYKRDAEKIGREMNGLMPSWERIAQLRKMRGSYISQNANEINKDLIALPDIFVRFIFYNAFISFAASFIYFFISNLTPIAVFFAKAIISSGLSFDKGLGVIISVFTILLLLVAVFFLEFFYPSFGSKDESEEERLDDIETKLAYACNVLDNEILPRIDNADIHIPTNIES